MMNRRTFARLPAPLLLVALAGAGRAADTDFAVRCRTLEATLGGRLGACWFDVDSGRIAGHRADERFPMCSSFKWLAAAAVLERVDRGQERLDRRIRFGRDALLAWAPVTRLHVQGDGMTVDALCEAAVAYSDNTAANLILHETGGIAGWNRYVRSIGDDASRLDRGEPQLNEALVGDPRDTTTPAAMVADLRRLLLADGLSATSRERLTAWMLATKTSDRRLRAGMPDGWRLADKTGTGAHGTGTAADVGVYWPPSGPPRVVAVYLTRARGSDAQLEAAIARIRAWVRTAG